MSPHVGSLCPCRTRVWLERDGERSGREGRARATPSAPGAPPGCEPWLRRLQGEASPSSEDRPQPHLLGSRAVTLSLQGNSTARRRPPGLEPQLHQQHRSLALDSSPPAAFSENGVASSQPLLVPRDHPSGDREACGEGCLRASCQWPWGAARLAQN